MDLIWGEDYDALADVARSVFDAQSPLTDRDHTPDFGSQVKQFAQLDWLTLGDPHGNSDVSTGLASIVALLVEQGRALVHSPLLGLLTARDTLLLCRTARSDALAADIGAGTAAVMPAFCNPDWRVPPPILEAGNLTGTVLAVPYGQDADVFLVEALEMDSDGAAVPVLLAVPRDDTVATDPMPNLGEHSMFAVTYSRSAVGADDVLARGAEVSEVCAEAMARASVLVAGQIYGAALSLLDRTVRYAGEREQFGGPVGRFQAVQYLCTDIAIGAHLTSAFVRDAARLIDEHENSDVAVALMAKKARRCAEEMVHAAHEVHAGIGFMVESDVHLFTKWAKKWAFDLGDDATHDQAILAGLTQRLNEDD